jgi:glucokinase
MADKFTHAIGVDLGGTFIKAGVVDSTGKLLRPSRVSRETEVEKGCDTVVANIVGAAADALEKSGLGWDAVCGLGVGSPGVFDLASDMLVLAPNLPCLVGRPLPTLIEKRLGRPLPIFLENDANCAAFGEKWAGVGRNAKNIVLFTLGTGIGGGIVIDGKLWRGARGSAAELGHQCVQVNGLPCGCGNRGCLEVYASATGMVRRFVEGVRAGRDSSLAGRVKANQKVTARLIHEAAVAGDDLAKDVEDETGKYLGVAVVNMLNVLDPEMVIFSGGMTASGDALLNPIKEEAARRACGLGLKGVSIVFGTLGNDAGLIGAAGCAFSRSGISV